MPVDALWPQISACQNPNLGALIEQLLELIGIQSSRWVNVLPIEIASTPLNVISLQNYCGPPLSVYPAGAPVPLSHFAEVLSQYLAEELNSNPLGNINRIIY